LARPLFKRGSKHNGACALLTPHHAAPSVLLSFPLPLNPLLYLYLYLMLASLAQASLAFAPLTHHLVACERAADHLSHLNISAFCRAPSVSGRRATVAYYAALARAIYPARVRTPVNTGGIWLSAAPLIILSSFPEPAYRAQLLQTDFISVRAFCLSDNISGAPHRLGINGDVISRLLRSGVSYAGALRLPSRNTRSWHSAVVPPRAGGKRHAPAAYELPRRLSVSRIQQRRGIALLTLAYS